MAVSFAQDIRPLFTDLDIAHMKRFRVILDDFGYMHDLAHAQHVLRRVNGGGMPPLELPRSDRQDRYLPLRGPSAARRRQTGLVGGRRHVPER
jgi:hypothetical protein